MVFQQLSRYLTSSR